LANNEAGARDVTVTPRVSHEYETLSVQLSEGNGANFSI